MLEELQDKKKYVLLLEVNFCVCHDIACPVHAMTGADCLKMANGKCLVMCISAFLNLNTYIYNPGMQKNCSLECLFFYINAFMETERLREAFWCRFAGNPLF